MYAIRIVVFLLLANASFAQVFTMKVQKNDICNYEFVADTSILYHLCEIGGIEISGVKKSHISVLKLLSKSNLTVGDHLTVNKDTLDKLIYNICKIEDIELDSVIVIKSKNQQIFSASYLEKIFIDLVFKSSPQLKFKIKCSVKNGDFTDYSATLLKDSSFVESRTQIKDSVVFNLGYNTIYTITLSKPGYVSKSVEVNTTAISEERIKEGFDPIECKIEIQPILKKKKIKYTQPVCFYYYDENLDGFGWKANYDYIIEK